MSEPIDHHSGRRHFLKVSGAALAGSAAGLSGVSAAAAPGARTATGRRKAELPRAKGPRLVIVGGGTSGLTIAKYAKREHPQFDVVLVEKRDMYSSCFSSNLWIGGLVNLEFIADHSFLDAARNNQYIFFNATVTGLDRTARILTTSEGDIAYDFLVLAPGIAYDYGRIGVKDIDTITALRTRYPGGFVSPTEHVSIRRKVQELEKGIFVQTVPSGNYRCLPAPYERACMIAAHIKKNKLPAKVLVLDANPDITIKKDGFHAVFSELYKGIIDYKPGSEITGIDLASRTLKTEFDSYTFDDAAIYPGVRASTLIEQFGLVDPKSPQKEARVSQLTNAVIGDERVYVTGDSRPHPYSKSGNTANTEGKHIARVLAARAQGKALAWESPRTVCFSMVSANPMEAISVDAGYVLNKAGTEVAGFSPDTKLFEKRDAAKGQGALEWTRGLYRDLFEA